MYISPAGGLSGNVICMRTTHHVGLVSSPPAAGSSATAPPAAWLQASRAPCPGLPRHCTIQSASTHKCRGASGTVATGACSAQPSAKPIPRAFCFIETTCCDSSKALALLLQYPAHPRGLFRATGEACMMCMPVIAAGAHLHFDVQILVSGAIAENHAPVAAKLGDRELHGSPMATLLLHWTPWIGVYGGVAPKKVLALTVTNEIPCTAFQCLTTHNCCS